MPRFLNLSQSLLKLFNCTQTFQKQFSTFLFFFITFDHFLIYFQLFLWLQQLFYSLQTFTRRHKVELFRIAFFFELLYILYRLKYFISDLKWNFRDEHCTDFSLRTKCENDFYLRNSFLLRIYPLLHPLIQKRHACIPFLRFI